MTLTLNPDLYSSFISCSLDILTLGKKAQCENQETVKQLIMNIDLV